MNEDREGLDQTKLEEGKESYTIPVGPINVALKEPLRLLFSEDGEIVRDVDIKAGYAHTGVENIANRRNPIQTLPLVQRICGICSQVHGFTYTRSVENALDIEVPERAQYIRVIMQELERIHSHLLWAGSAANQIGFETLFYYIWKERENVMDALEYVSGNRVNYEINLIGGVRRDLTPKRLEKLEEALKFYEEIYQEVEDTIIRDRTVKMRTRNIGILEKQEALELGAVGPTTRGSGVKKDNRTDHPASAYADLNIKPMTPNRIFGETHCDVYDRLAVRVKEIEQSIDIVRECMARLPDGEIAYEENLVKLLKDLRSRSGRGVARTEAPRGELFYYFQKKADEEKIHNLKVRTPTYGNIMSLRPMFLGQQIADIPIVAASIDPCMSCMDRVVTVQGDNKKTYTKDELVEMSKKKTRRMKNG
ncbi:nickel-dependent hydrogenase large subunit [Methanonatronarchaeum sp. AMET-Sl]|uniref:hydrogenase large subunit n=1 Tax=Methanonatronarchaeum sp. AMET-Sl TaxID=3037654 RepID=UPI00244E2328|nr:nickel-dependent hydrogenase large subunit [Methanonatronarchaeum sp. AMET-Sl]WGI16708.1 nickel-dependent hydrogenase large subunit [Methanonatronarchaeum sp. AMET-Sl]